MIYWYLLVPVNCYTYNMVVCKSYVTQITVILTTKLTVLVIHIRGVWGCSQEFFPSGITGFKLYLCKKTEILKMGLTDMNSSYFPATFEFWN